MVRVSSTKSCYENTLSGVARIKTPIVSKDISAFLVGGFYVNLFAAKLPRHSLFQGGIKFFP